MNSHVLVLTLLAFAGCVSEPPGGDRVSFSLTEVDAPQRAIPINGSDLLDEDLAPLRDTLNTGSKRIQTTTNASRQLQDNLNARYAALFGEQPSGGMVIAYESRYFELHFVV